MRWYDGYQSLRAKCTEQEWAALGFWKNGYSYWLIIQLLLTKRARDNYLVLAEPCIDKLAKLKVLMYDDKSA